MYGSWVWIARASGYGWEPYILSCSHIFDPIDLRLDIPSACKQIHPIVLGIELLTKESSAGTVWHQLIQVPQSKASVVVGRHHLACPTAFLLMSNCWKIRESSSKHAWPSWSYQHCLQSLWPESRTRLLVMLVCLSHKMGT